MRRALRTIAKRPRLEVRLEDRFHHQLQRPLYYPVTDAGNRKCSGLVAPFFRYLFLPRPQRHVGALDQFVPDLLKETFHALFLDGLEADSVTARSSIIGFSHRVRSAQRLHLADVNVQTPESPVRFSLRLGVYLPSQVLQTNGRRCHFALASRIAGRVQTAGPLRSAGVTPLHRYFGPVRHPLAFGRFPGVAGYTAYLAPTCFSPGRGGLLQLLSTSLPPCRR